MITRLDWNSNDWRRLSRIVATFIWVGAAHAVVLFLPSFRVRADAAPDSRPGFRAALIRPADAAPVPLAELKRAGYTAAVLNLDDSTGRQDQEAAQRILESGLGLYYWIEIGRNPAIADAHPEWMASIQGHPEWRRFFPQFPTAKTNEVVKAYPWTPVLYRESFSAHLERVKRLLVGKPASSGIFLNDLQGAPSACGCGHQLCRWTTDYGPIKTATRLPNDAAAKFVAAVSTNFPHARIIPVWTPECEEHDRDGLCAGVACFQGACWKEFTVQLMPLEKEAATIAALLPYRDFQRDLPIYGPHAGWIKHAVASFAEMPLRRNGTGVPSSRILAVLQGWDVTPEQVRAQIAMSEEAGCAGCVVSFMKIEQGWEPRLIRASGVAKY